MRLCFANEKYEACRVMLVFRIFSNKAIMPKQVYLASLRWEVAENIFMKMTRSAWEAEDFEALDNLFPELRASSLSYSEATNFIWAVGKNVITERCPTDSMLEWIYHTFFVDSPMPLRDWGLLAQSLYRERNGVLPPKWIAHTSRILSDDNDTGILEFPKEWIFAWASEQKHVLEYCHGNFVRPALKTWPAEEGQRLLGLLESGMADPFSFHCALLAGAADVSFHIPLSKICAIYWPGELEKWLTWEALDTDPSTWVRLLVANDLETLTPSLPSGLTF